jgi:hypothetical protein
MQPKAITSLVHADGINRVKATKPILRAVHNRTSESCDSEMSTSTFAAGCTMSNSFMIVAPSLLIVTLPCNHTSSKVTSTLALRALQHDSSTPFRKRTVPSAAPLAVVHETSISTVMSLGSSAPCHRV